MDSWTRRIAEMLGLGDVNATSARVALDNGGAAVSGTNPLPVGAPPPASPVTAQIANGASISGDIDLAANRLHRIAFPATWTAAVVTFQVSSTGSNWNDLYDKDGEVTVTNAAASRSIVVNQANFYGVRYVRLRSGTAAAPVNQGGNRDLTLVTVPR